MKLKLLSCVALLLGFGSGSALGNQIRLIEIKVFPETQIESDRFTLGDVSEIDGYDLEAIQRIAALDLGSSPSVGLKLRLSAARIEKMVKRAFPDHWFEVTVPKRAVVERKSEVFGEDEVREILSEAIAEKYGEHGIYDFEISSRIPSIALPTGRVTHEVTETGRGESLGGNKNWRISFFVDDRKARSIYVRTLVDVQALTPGEVEKQVDPAAQVAAAPKKTPENLAALENDPSISEIRKPGASKPRRNLSRVSRGKSESRSGSGFLYRAPDGAKSLLPDVVRGKRVVLKYISAHIELKTIATSLQSGRIGDVIMVKNLTSNKRIQARVIEKNTVKVIL